MPEAPVLVTDRPVNEWLKPVAGKPGTFRASGVARTVSTAGTMDLEFAPFYAVHRRTYGAYWEFLTNAELEARRAALAAEKARVAQLEAATVAHLSPVEPASEKPFNMQGDETTIVRADGKPGRRSAKWFSYDLTSNGVSPIAIVVTYNSDQRRTRSHEILVDGQRVGETTVPQGSVAKFYDVEYAVPAALSAAKQKLAVRFQATNGNETAPVFGVRIVKK